MTFERLPLFPLGLVLFPGTAVPLHIFEPRYRQMLKDVSAGDRRFGIVCTMPGVPQHELPRGRVGCVAEVTEVTMLHDGCSNIVVEGRERFALDEFLRDDAPYHVVSASTFDDRSDSSPVALVVAADEVTSNLKRVVRALNALENRTIPVPDLPEDPGELSWAIAGMIDMDLEGRQRLLNLDSAEARLTMVDGLLRRSLPDLEFQAAMHRRA